MQLFYRLFRFLFTVYAALIFGSSFLIVVPCYFFIFNFFSIQKSPHIAHRLSRAWARCIYSLLFIKLKIENKNFIDPKATYIFISNHLSILDIPLFALSCKNTFRFLSKAELAKIPVLGYIIKNLYITVNRNDKNDRSLSIKKMNQSLKEGISVFLCPEGTRNQSKELLLPFKDGAFRLAMESQKPLAVLTIVNSKKLLDSTRWFELAPGTIYAAWSIPFNTNELNNKSLEGIKEKVRDQMLTVLKSYKNKQQINN